MNGEAPRLLDGSAMPPLLGYRYTSITEPDTSVDIPMQPATNVTTASTTQLNSRFFSRKGPPFDATWTENLGDDGFQGLFICPDHGQRSEVNDASAALNSSFLEIDLLASFGLPTAYSSTRNSEAELSTQFESLPWHPPLPWDGQPPSLIGAPSDEQRLPIRDNESASNVQPTLPGTYGINPQRHSSIMNTPSFLGNDDYWVKLVYGYPQLMLKIGTYPPFVHHTIYRCSEGEVLEPLAIAFCCLGAYNASLPTSRDFTYSLINKERDQLVTRFPQACATMSDVSVLASVHAMCIYQIIRFFGSRSHQATNAELQQPFFLKMARYLAGTHLDQKAEEELTWEAWAMNETIRRTIFLINAINCLSSRVGRQDPIFYEPLDDDLLSSLALPSPTCLWKAKSSSEWRNKHLARDVASLRILSTTAGKFLDARMSRHDADTPCQQFKGIASTSDHIAFDGLEQFTRLVLATLRSNPGY
ncbi:Fc.00g097950.m01.CDS01 [Cosmosporella sp. VM-42]